MAEIVLRETLRYVHTGDSQSALKMLDDMVADGVRPDLFSYSTVLACVSGPLGNINIVEYQRQRLFV